MLDPVLTLASELVRLPSHAGVRRQEFAVALRLAEFLQQRGVAARLIEVREGRPNLLACVDSGQPGPHLLLFGHTDTVPLNRDAAGVAFSGAVVGDSLQGRGAADMKGALAAMAGALAALHNGSGLAAGKVTLAAVIDEELESLGCEALIADGLRASGAIIGEPTQNRLALGHKGLEWLEVVFTGRAAHGGTPEAGVNAINAAAHFVMLVEERLVPALQRKTHPLLGSPTINCGSILGGDQPSTVAASCLLRIDRRSVPGESYLSVCVELRELLHDVERRRPGVLSEVRRMPGGMATMEHLPAVIDPSHVLACAARHACETVTGIVQTEFAFPAWTDAGLLSNFAAIPCVILGPGDLSVAHTPWEAVPTAQVMQAVSIFYESARRFCGGAA